MSETLSTRQQAILPIAAFAALGDMPKLEEVLNKGLDDGLAVSDAKEVLVQAYAYVGFPRSLNALAKLMEVVQSRKARGIDDDPGHEPGRQIPAGTALLEAGTANQTKLVGQRVEGALFEFAPAIDTYLKTHLFGDIFERDNLDWQSRELATVGFLSALAGVESQLQSHIRISRNVGLSVAQLRQAAQVLTERVNSETGQRVSAAVAATSLAQ
ncbi:carboxymuconolactone decarboxylase family protein [Pseudomonas sp. 3A(2025)]